MKLSKLSHTNSRVAQVSRTLTLKGLSVDSDEAMTVKAMPLRPTADDRAAVHEATTNKSGDLTVEDRIAALARYLDRLISEWDVRDDDDNSVAPSFETFCTLPLEFLVAFVTEVNLELSGVPLEQTATS